jgi:nitroimidazol reductase NimA-like FMN-containing flavoprotein (pyridoxamine 5'-phosphate oxidase superfamily)
MTAHGVEKRFSDERIWRSLSRILRENVLCSISTVAPGNRAHINTAYFCYTPDLVLYFLSDPGSRHCRNLERNPSLAMTIFRSDQEWGGQDRGLQLFGTCRCTRGRGTKEAERSYAARFSPYGAWMKGLSPAERRQAALLRSYAFYRFLPRRVKILDEREFGGAIFVTAAVARGGHSKTVVSWSGTEVLSP